MIDDISMILRFLGGGVVQKLGTAISNNNLLRWAMGLTNWLVTGDITPYIGYIPNIINLLTSYITNSMAHISIKMGVKLYREKNPFPYHNKPY